MKLYPSLSKLLANLSLDQQHPPDAASWEKLLHALNHYCEDTDRQLTPLTEAFDELTQLPSRAFLLNTLQKIIANAAQRNYHFAVIHVDIDHFNKVNEFYGQTVGDQVLIELARRLNNTCRDVDICTRISGDEFVLILDNIEHSNFADKTSRKMLKVINKAIQIDDHKIIVHASIGVAVYPYAAKEAETLLINARRASELAHQKDGNNFQYYTDELNAAAERYVEIENKLQKAIERNELYLHYQPQLEAKTGKVIGVEALCRWKNPDIGQVPPMEFITVAEDSGLILDIGAWILKDAIRQYFEWCDAYPDLFKSIHFSINVSPMQLRHHEIISDLETIFNQYDYEQHHIQFEITERTLLNLDDETLEAIKFLQKLDIDLSIDDFGSGYSSLFYLHQLPIKEIKIDQSFVSSIPINKLNTEIIRAIINLAKHLNVRTVAEGVETYEQYEFLIKNHCDRIQGYYVRPPLTPASLIEYIVSKS